MRKPYRVLDTNQLMLYSRTLEISQKPLLPTEQPLSWNQTSLMHTVTWLIVYRWVCHPSGLLLESGCLWDSKGTVRCSGWHVWLAVDRLCVTGQTTVPGWRDWFTSWRISWPRTVCPRSTPTTACSTPCLTKWGRPSRPGMPTSAWRK